jgi:hypothetical protein
VTARIRWPARRAVILMATGDSHREVESWLTPTSRQSDSERCRNRVHDARACALIVRFCDQPVCWQPLSQLARIFRLRMRVRPVRVLEVQGRTWRWAVVSAAYSPRCLLKPAGAEGRVALCDPCAEFWHSVMAARFHPRDRPWNGKASTAPRRQKPVEPARRKSSTSIPREHPVAGSITGPPLLPRSARRPASRLSAVGANRLLSVASPTTRCFRR